MAERCLANWWRFTDSPKDHALIRMVCSSLATNLWKLYELLKHFGKEVHDSGETHCSRANAIKKIIEEKDIYGFRSKYAAHAIDNDTKLPLSLAAGEQRIRSIFGETIGEMNAFCSWVCPEIGERKEESVTRFIVDFRDYCRANSGAHSDRP
jgi:hypothetical protein